MISDVIGLLICTVLLVWVSWPQRKVCYDSKIAVWFDHHLWGVEKEVKCYHLDSHSCAATLLERECIRCGSTEMRWSHETKWRCTTEVEDKK